jgi:hypothetical protein
MNQVTNEVINQTEPLNLTSDLITHIKAFFESRGLESSFVCLAFLAHDVLVGSNMKKLEAIHAVMDYLAHEHESVEKVLANLGAEE